MPGPLASSEVLFAGDGAASRAVLGVSLRGHDAAPPWAIAETSDARACIAHLGAPVDTPVRARFEGDAASTEHGWLRVRADIEGEGEGDEGEVEVARVRYELVVDKRVALPARTDGWNDPYTRCCQEHDCGWGYVSHAYHGRGELAFLDDGGRVVHRMPVSGWVAGGVRVTIERARPDLAATGPTSELAARSRATEETAATAESLAVEPVGSGYVWRADDGHLLSENEVARRYEAATGSMLLEPFYTPRSSAWIVWTTVGAVLFAGGIGFLTLALADEDHFEYSIPLAAGLGLGGSILFVLGLTEPVFYDGYAEPNGNLIRESDARVVVESHRRAGASR